MAVEMKKTGAETVGWDLQALYAGPEDKAIAADVAALVARYAAFEKTFKASWRPVWAMRWKKPARL